MPASHLLTLVGHTGLSKAQTQSSSPKSPTFVTVSQAPSGMPVVRRILPKVIPMSSVSSPASVSGVMPILHSSKPKSPSVISGIPLLTPVTSENSSKTSALQLTPIASSELESLLKTSSSRITVGPLNSTAKSDLPKEKESQLSNARQMPPLSIASLHSLLPVSTIQAQSTTPTQTRTVSASQTCVTTSSTNEVLSCQGPVSGELQSHANKVRINHISNCSTQSCLYIANIPAAFLKLTDVFMGCLKDCLSEMSSMGNLEAQVRCLQLDMEHLQWRHQQEMEELRHNTGQYFFYGMMCR